MALSFFTGFFLFFSLLAQPIGFFSNLGIEKFISFLEEKIQQGLKVTFRKSFIRSLIRFGTTYVGIFIVVFKPFGYEISMIVAALIFIVNIIWTFTTFIINSIKFVPRFYKIPCYLCKTKSLSQTALKVVDDNWDYIFNEEEINKFGFFKRNLLKLLKKTCATSIGNAYTNFKEVGGNFSNRFKELPGVKEIAHSLFKYVLTFILKYIIFFAIYFIILHLLQPLILEVYVGISKWEIILFPFVQIKNTILLLFNSF